MGQSASFQQPQCPQIKIRHNKFRQAQYHPQDKVIFTKLKIPTQNQYLKWHQKLQPTTRIDRTHLLLPLSYQFNKQVLCGYAGDLQLQYDYYALLLRDEIENRKSIKWYFDQVEVWYILYCIVSAAHELEKIGSVVGYLRPDNIFVNQSGQIKVASIHSWPVTPEPYPSQSYKSPQQCFIASQGHSYINKHVSQSFSIGMTILQCASLLSIESIYGQEQKLNLSRFDHVIKQWCDLKFLAKEQVEAEEEDGSWWNFGDGGVQVKKECVREYSDVLKIFVIGMCQKQPENRLTFDQVYSILYPLRKHITELQLFIHSPNISSIINNQDTMNISNQTLNRKFKIYLTQLKQEKQKTNSLYHVRSYSQLNSYQNPEQFRIKTIVNGHQPVQAQRKQSYANVYQNLRSRICKTNNYTSKNLGNTTDTSYTADCSSYNNKINQNHSSTYYPQIAPPAPSYSPYPITIQPTQLIYYPTPIAQPAVNVPSQETLSPTKTKTNYNKSFSLNVNDYKPGDALGANDGERNRQDNPGRLYKHSSLLSNLEQFSGEPVQVQISNNSSYRTPIKHVQSLQLTQFKTPYIQHMQSLQLTQYRPGENFIDSSSQVNCNSLNKSNDLTNHQQSSPFRVSNGANHDTYSHTLVHKKSISMEKQPVYTSVHQKSVTKAIVSVSNSKVSSGSRVSTARLNGSLSYANNDAKRSSSPKPELVQKFSSFELQNRRKLFNREENQDILKKIERQISISKQILNDL